MKKAWLSLLALTIAGSIGTACTITTTDDDTDGGATGFGGKASGGAATSGGSTAKGGASSGGTAGSGAGGASSGGSAAGGVGGAPDPVMCDVGLEPTGTPAQSCVFDVPDNTPCHECLAKDADCCAAIKECYGTGPRNQCAYGGPDGGSEFTCIEACIRQKVLNTGSYSNDDEDVCVNACATPACGLIGNATNLILGCMHANCETECFEPTK